MENAVAPTPEDRVADLIRDHLRSADVDEVFGPEVPLDHPAFDYEERFYTPLSMGSVAWPFDPERPGVRPFRDSLLDCILYLRRAMAEKRLRNQDLKAFRPLPGEPDFALAYFRIGATIFAARAVSTPSLPHGEEAADGPDSPWDLAVIVAVDDEAIE
jgi:hypothetical protein